MPGVSDNARGALFMMGSMAAFTLNDALIKALAGDLPLSQAIFLRGVLTSVLMIALARMTGALSFRFAKPDRWRVAVRTFTDVATSYFFLTALYNMPIANATAILQALPLTVTLAGVLFLGEIVGWRRWAAILLGLVGVMLIIKPGAAGFNSYALYAVVAVGLVTVRDVVTRGMSAQVSSVTIGLVNALAVTITFGLVTATRPWVAVSTESWLILGGASCAIILAYITSVAAMRWGEIAAVTPFRYTGLLWALILGWFVFGDWPDNVTLFGAGLVVVSGLFTLYRSQATKREGRS